MPKEVSEYKQSLHLRCDQLFTLNPHRFLNIECNARISKLYHKYSCIQQYLEEQTLEADAFKDILGSLLPDIDSRDNIPLQLSLLRTPVPYPSLVTTRHPRAYTAFPNYAPDGYSSDNA